MSRCKAFGDYMKEDDILCGKCSDTLKAECKIETRKRKKEKERDSRCC